MIKQAIKLENALDSYYYKISFLNHEANRNFDLDEITSNNWKMLIKIKSILKPFYITTKHLKGIAIKKSQDTLCGVVIGLECLI